MHTRFPQLAPIEINSPFQMNTNEMNMELTSQLMTPLSAEFTPSFSSDSFTYSFDSQPAQVVTSPPDTPSFPDLINAYPSSRSLRATRKVSSDPFSCPVCHLQFSRKNSMSRHVLSHINLRPYTCVPCNRSFYRVDIYRRHLNSNRCQKRCQSQPNYTPFEPQE